MLCGMKNINEDPPHHDIAQGLVVISSSFKNRLNNPSIFISGYSYIHIY